MQVKIRPALADDKHFVLSTWLRNYYHSSYFARSIRKTIFFDWHHRVLVAILSRPSVQVAVACADDSPDVIYGYIVYEKQPDTDVIHYVYVKKPFRGFGLGKQLLKETGFAKFEFTHATTSSQDWMRANQDNHYNPYRI